MSNKYYVYEWIRLDTNEPFYVGKGCDDRWKDLTRGNNNHFNNIVKSVPCVVNILHDNLDEETAFGLEVWYIREYRDIIGYELVNILDGGEGHGLCGSANGMYGKKHSIETKNKIGKKSKERSQGKNNPMYGKNWKDGKTEEEILEHNKKISQSNKGNNPWKNKTEEEKNKIRQKLSKAHLDLNIKGGNHPNSKSVICLTTKKIFLSATEGSEYYNCDTSGIIKCCKRKNKSCGKINGYKLVWRYLVWEHKKYYKIKKEG